VADGANSKHWRVNHAVLANVQNGYLRSGQCVAASGHFETPMKKTDTTDPRGRLDVLALRLCETAAREVEQARPELRGLWETFKPYIEPEIRHHLAPRRHRA
jgi:hypothetical protein